MTLSSDNAGPVGAWGNKWNMSFNEGKSVHIRFLTKPSIQQHTYRINNLNILSSDHYKDLGVIMSCNLSWSKHYLHIVSKAYRSLGVIRRTFSNNLTAAKKQLYLSLVRSQLMYCSPIWRPYQIKDIIILERIQKRATKYILNDFSSDYKSRLTSLHILPLMYYFELNDIIFFVNSLKHPADHFRISDYITFSNSNTRSSSHRKLQHTNASTTSFRHFYFNRIPRLWNSLPPIDLDSSIASIKFNLTKFLWTHFQVNFDSSDSCTFHYLCPCSKCLSSSNSTHFNIN